MIAAAPHFASIAETVGGWSTFLLAWLGVLAFLGALLGVAQTREDGKRARTLEYLSRLYSQEFAPLNGQVMAFLKTADPDAFVPGARLDRDIPATGEEVEAAFNGMDIETKARVVLVLNFYEELSCSYREGLLDEEVAGKMLLPAVETVWGRAEPLIRQLRLQTQRQLDEGKSEKPPKGVKPKEQMEEWEELVKSLEKGKTLSRRVADGMDPTMWFDGLIVRGVGLLAAALIAAGLIAVGSTH